MRPALSSALPGVSLPPGAEALQDETAPPPAPGPTANPRAVARRLQGLLVLALLACLSLFLLTVALAELPHLDAIWRPAAQGGVELVSSPLPALQDRGGEPLLALGTAPVSTVDALLLKRSSRGLLGTDNRLRHASQQALLYGAFATPKVTLQLGPDRLQVPAQPRGFAGLGAPYWLLASLALMLCLAGLAVALAVPGPGPWMYSLVALAESANLLLLAVESLAGLGRPALPPGWALPLCTGLDLGTAAAAVSGVVLYPVRLRGALPIVAGAWAVAVGMTATVTLELPQGALLAQLALGAFSACWLLLLGRSYGVRPHPLVLVVGRLGAVVLGTLLLLTVALASADDQPGLRNMIADLGTVTWHVFFASLLLLLPFLWRTQRLLREFALLAGVGTVATSLDLLLVTLFSASPFTSLTLAVFLSLGVYAAARQWLVRHLMGRRLLTTEYLFEELYRIARRLEVKPERAADELIGLLRHLFEPLECERLPTAPPRAQVSDQGSALVVPLPVLDDQPAERHEGAVRLCFAHRGRRLFNETDARLTSRLVDQLRQAVAHHRAVELGRREERARIAQDLHDDIGARLLTLMYKAPTPEVEDYLRHTLQDLKTLTRGLAASHHRLQDAAADWKSDAALRLAAAECRLSWRFQADRDVELSVVQWSALTRLLRELLTNVLAHARAQQVEVELVYEDNALTLSVTDDGLGRDPAGWSHGLGLGGVRKRARLLGGSVSWQEREPRGIVCRVQVPQLAAEG